MGLSIVVITFSHRSTMTQDFTLAQILSGDTQALGQAIALVAKASRQTPPQLQQAITSQWLEPAWQQLDPRLKPLIDKLRPECEQWLCADEATYLDNRHPARRLFERIHYHLNRWYPRASKPSQQFYDRFAQAVDSPDQASLHAFVDWADSDAQRAAMLSARLVETEAGQMRLIAIECQVVQALNEHLAHRLFPQDSADQLDAVLKSELQHNLSTTTGDEAPFWKLWQKLLPRLGQVFGDGQNLPDDQWLYSQIPSLIGELERSLELPLSNPALYRLWTEQLCQALMLAIQKKSQPLSILEPLPYPEGYSQTGTRITPSLLQQSQSLEVGNWLVFETEAAPIRTLLAHKNTAAGQLLLVDQAGRKIMSKSLKDMALSLSTGIARPLPEFSLRPNIEPLLSKLVAQAHKLLQQQQAIYEVQARQAAEAAERAMQEQLELRHAAARKALAEARALAEEKERRAVEAAHLREQQRLAKLADAEARRLAAIATVNQLRVGAWMELEEPPGQVRRCKLSVILGNSGKYIFVDQLGRKLAELQREPLIELLQQDRLRLLRQGGDFEDQLAKVIRGLRKDTHS
ncbi:conserved hypothetical protein [Cellvibrio japonicus Ueda107]|uniref:DUF1631 family protein n=2 Tax=Cellvibrio japonicus TaxID=155077 RepID=B3PDD0_CELJU|nr:conserved hypothetical protein [Cellvibrio japonicus Ueda107]QEI13380.1 DUF1631 domain-containing protein [Cellvibrio japonicus]QEI16954.1 DUF1631 domain-containing protein [Cellvibrio japonicus]QEI20532.1 DUF1631 domain-containing protein [Cellvibrio japonicus]